MILLVGSIVYLALFYGGDALERLPSPIGNLVKFLTGDLTQINKLRRVAWVLLPAPDVLADSWVVNDWSRFGLFDHLPVIFGAAVILFVAYLTGRLLLEMLHVDRTLSRLERFVFGIGVGLNLWSLLTLAVGLAGGLQSRWPFFLTAITVAGLSAWRASTWLRLAPVAIVPIPTFDGESKTTLTDIVEQPPWLARVALWLALPFCILIILGGTLPPTHFDVREYHLQVPKEWFLQGHVNFMPHNVYGNMPLGAEMHAILGMVIWPGESNWWWGALIGKTVIASLAPLTALAVYAAATRFYSKSAAAIAASVFISTPWIAHVSMNGLIDGASAFYALLAVYAALLYRQGQQAGSASGVGDPKVRSVSQSPKENDVADSNSSDRAESRSAGLRSQIGLTLLCGFLAGAGVACKYPALLFVVAPVFFVLFIRRFWQFDFRAGVIYVLAVIAGCGLWFGKNWALSGNPTYPLLYRWFDGKSWNEDKDERWRHAHGPPHGGGVAAFTPHEFWNCVQLLFIRSDYLAPALWPLAAFGLWSTRRRRATQLLIGLMLWTTAFWWFMTHRIDRFLVPLLPFAAIIAGVGATSGRTKSWSLAVAALLLVSSAATFVYDATPIVSDSRLLLSLRDLRTDIPRHEDEFTHINRAHRYLNEHVQPSFRALLVGEAQVFDFEVPVLYNTCFDDCQFELLTRAKSRDERFAAFREHRISHLFVTWYELDRYRSPGNYGYSLYPTRQLIRDEMAAEQKLLQRLPLDLNPESGEVYEVVGWREWGAD